MPDDCEECGKSFIRTKPNQRFCPGGLCRIKHHNEEKKFPLTPRLRAVVLDLAAAHDVSGNEMLCRMVDHLTNPDGQPITLEELTG
jgi:hypothetical protein